MATCYKVCCLPYTLQKDLTILNDNTNHGDKSEAIESTSNEDGPSESTVYGSLDTLKRNPGMYETHVSCLA